tara:strand:- start:7728 stop:10223 length:2496 start_codon:yes stop_codon:yes gene_type:complete
MFDEEILETPGFQEEKDKLPKEPEGDVDKEYVVVCHTNEGWQTIHSLIMEENTSEDYVPNTSKKCCNDKKHSPTRGIYMMTDSEAEELRSHELVETVNINRAAYPGTYRIDPALMKDGIGPQYRYGSNVKHQKDPTFPSTPTLADLNRAGYAILRHSSYQDPWYGSSASTVINDRAQHYGAGEDTDIITVDEDMWFGHIEFQNNTGTGPTNYKGGNVLPGNGTCDLLCLVNDSPYYIDPDFFDADPTNRLETRWDGTIVPTEAAANGWWRNNSLSYRSSKFVSPSNGGTATGNNDFGTILVSSNYTRARQNGSNTAYQTSGGSHSTPCASLAYGRSYGWAYNANKWHIALMGSYAVDEEDIFDMIKIFHQCKPINPTYGNRDHTLCTNSYGYRSYAPPSSGYYYYETPDDGTGGVYYSSKPKFLSNFYQSYIRSEMLPNSLLTAGNEMIDAGVIFVCSAGNTRQKLVKATHPSWYNYVSTSNNHTMADTQFSSGGFNWVKSVNRQGFPGQIGKVGVGTNTVYRTFPIGCLSGGHRSDGREQRAVYSNMGNLIVGFAAGDRQAAACDDNAGSRKNRYDAYYTLNGVQSVESEDREFNGTSAASPVACGFLATKMQHNRTWDWQDLMNWIESLTPVNSSEFYYGTESTTATDNNWDDDYSIEGHPGYVFYDATTGGNESSYRWDAASGNVATQNPKEVTEGGTATVTLSTNAPDGTYYYVVEKDDHQSDIQASDFDTGGGFLGMYGAFSVSGGAATLNFKIAADAVAVNETESFRVRVRSGSTTGPVVATSHDFIILDSSSGGGGGGGGTPATPFVFASGDGLTFTGVSISFS